MKKVNGVGIDSRTVTPENIKNIKFADYVSNVTDPEILKVLSYYRIKREDAEKEMGQS